MLPVHKDYCIAGPGEAVYVVWTCVPYISIEQSYHPAKALMDMEEI